MSFHLYKNNNGIAIDHYENKILTNLPDKDASVLCELVYESRALDFALNSPDLKDSSLANIFYENKRKVIEDKELNLSPDVKDALEQYPHNYYPVLAKYKLVATSLDLVSKTQSNFFGTAPSYYAIVVANVNDKENKGIYIINRGTDKAWDYWSDLKMGHGKLIPSAEIIPHMIAGINFTQEVLAQYQVRSIGFSGHSLGGSIAQIQSIRFFDYKKGLSLAPTKCFEPFGTKSEVDPSFGFRFKNKYYYSDINLWKGFRSQVCNVGIEWKCNSWQELSDRLIHKYQRNAKFIANNIKNFIRQGDIIAELSAQIGDSIKLTTNINNNYYNYIPQQTSGLIAVPQFLFELLRRLTIHKISWYRYNAYAENGDLIPNQIDKKNVKIFKFSANYKDIQSFREAFKDDN
ncbi:hypothetical protein FRA_50c14720 [Francisella sp. W12-1067]|nr:hypothetical protein FRA_50c14720 [Francisella sp. W12-1067]